MSHILSAPEIVKLNVALTVGVTATQEGLSHVQLEAFRWFLKAMFRVSRFHHGDCIGGDCQLAQIATEHNIRVVAHPPINKVKRAFAPSHEWMESKPYLERNHDIVDQTFMLWGFPKGPEELRSGTWSTIRYAWKRRKPVIIVYPEGTMEGFFGY